MDLAWFEPDQKTWKERCQREPAAQIIKAVIQNMLDGRGLSSLDVELQYSAGVTRIVLEDDALGGVADVDKPWTLFVSGREDDTSYRGRLGRCLKTFVALMDEVVIQTRGTTIRIDNRREEPRRVQEPNSKGRGTRIEAIGSSWEHRDVSRAQELIQAIQLPEHMELYLNGKLVENSQPAEGMSLKLATVIFDEEGREWPSVRDTDVLVRKARDTGILYEMGVPVDDLKIGYDVDVQQRVPMDKRYRVKEPYTRNLTTQVLGGLIELRT